MGETKKGIVGKGLFVGISIGMAYFLLKEREYNEMKKFSFWIDVDYRGFEEMKEKVKCVNNYFELLKYRFKIPKVCIKNYAKKKQKIIKEAIESVQDKVKKWL